MAPDAASPATCSGPNTIEKITFSVGGGGGGRDHHQISNQIEGKILELPQQFVTFNYVLKRDLGC
jgi:hypothetical protein